MRTVLETISKLAELMNSPDICYACDDDPMCDEEKCVLTDAIYHLIAYMNNENGRNGDVISRSNLMAEFRKFVRECDKNKLTPDWNDAVSLVGSMPSVDLTAKATRVATPELYRCAKCKNYVTKEFNYCPYCGRELEWE